MRQTSRQHMFDIFGEEPPCYLDCVDNTIIKIDPGTYKVIIDPQESYYVKKLHDNQNHQITRVYQSISQTIADVEMLKAFVAKRKPKALYFVPDKYGRIIREDGTIQFHAAGINAMDDMEFGNQPFKVGG